MRPAGFAARQHGTSAIELALVLPFLLLLATVGYDFSRAIQEDAVLVNMSREGANLMSRSAESPAFAQAVMNALGDTAMPNYLETPTSNSWKSGTQFEKDTGIVVTRIKGTLNAAKKVDITVTAQYHWLRGGITPVSKVWNCGSSWQSDGSCQIGANPPVITLQGLLAGDAINDGDVIYAVEVFHNYKAMFGGMPLGASLIVPTVGPNLYAMAMF